MVSRRNFFSITIIMLIILFLFQFTNVALDAWNDYDQNSYAVDVKSLPGQSGAYNANTSQSLKNSWEEDRRTVAFIGSGEALRQTVGNWATYAKWNVQEYPHLGGYEAARQSGGTAAPQMIVLDGAGINWAQEDVCALLEGYVSAGIHLVFASLPDVSIIGQNRRLQDLLGIQEVRSIQTRVKGLHLYKDFLLGGEVIYQAEEGETDKKQQDMELNFPWYVLAAGTKTYMKGIPEEEAKPEDHPAVIWRNSRGTAYVFAVNGRYMEGAAGLGVLSAMRKEMEAYTIYPVVNAQNLVLANFPGLAAENGGEMTRYYSRSLRDVFRDVIWPDVMAACQQNRFGLSCMLAPQFDYTGGAAPNQVELLYYMKRLNEQKAEAGISGTSVSSTPAAAKLAADFQFFQAASLNYQFTSYYAGGSGREQETANALEHPGLSAVRTVVEEYGGSEVVGYLSANVTRQSAVADGFTHTFMQDFNVRCVETSLAYNSILADMTRAAYPESTKDTWNVLSEVLKINLSHYWEEFGYFDGVCVSECDARIRNFLALDYMDTPNEDGISLKLAGAQAPVWFILRLSGGQVESVEGGSFRQLEDTAYLIEAQGEEITIRLKEADGAYFG